ncbi:AAA family ATPase [Algoriphagus sp.]|uniref:AAA family ATPase n=1 Tax=Algoriphagus sp. TaxID=1872435 RepID=UPI00271943FF|nr:AAA family ATPase [Algoriphagus sp.]MDO8967178.1 AAA family ATPase [Algoriphagus sp.]MDP3198322.1 AAA family ATPase [Algoriphagus sp.]
MKIEKIRVKNFKGFEDEIFFLNPHFTVFIGENAKGKTSVLDALAVAAGSFLRGIDVAKLESRSIGKNEIRVATKNNQPVPQLPVEIQAFGNVNEKTIEKGWLRTVDKISPKKTNTTFVKAKNIEKVAAEMLKLSRAGKNVVFPVIAYHGTGRLWAEHEEKKTAYKKTGEGVSQAYTNCLSPKSSSKEFLSWYKTYEDEIRKFDQDSDKLLLKTFNRSIISMIPNNHWQDMAYSFAVDDLTGIFIFPNGNKEKLQFSQLSDGYRNIIGMVADIAYRCIKLNPHLGENAVKLTPGIVLIDELDLHLHPNWQRRIVDDLKNTFPNIQFVATTHSPFIVQSLKSDEIWNLDKLMDVTPDELKIDTVSTEIMGVSSPYSELNDDLYNKSKKFMQNLETNKSIGELQKELDEISDPAIRAFLELQKISKGK